VSYEERVSDSQVSGIGDTVANPSTSGADRGC
jgi:hypothetical protein